MRDSMILGSVGQIRALAHPERQRVLRLLTTGSMTNKQLADTLGESPARLHFHVRELLAAGLIELVEERPKGGVLEKYYRAAARSFRLEAAFGEAPAGEGGLAGATLTAARREAARAEEYFGSPLPATRILHEQAVVSGARLERILGHLDAIGEELRVAAESPDGGGRPMLLTVVLHPLAPDVREGEQPPVR
jgi:DNA-binding transcriptional ArsR family regulator